jgi:hypothetical protein
MKIVGYSKKITSLVRLRFLIAINKVCGGAKTIKVTTATLVTGSNMVVDILYA